MMLFRPTGLITERRHKQEIEEGTADTPLYDVTHEGAAPTATRPMTDLLHAVKVRKEFGGLSRSTTSTSRSRPGRSSA